jgi:hypothetical protein
MKGRSDREKTILLVIIGIYIGFFLTIVSLWLRDSQSIGVLVVPSFCYLIGKG